MTRHSSMRRSRIHLSKARVLKSAVAATMLLGTTSLGQSQHSWTFVGSGAWGTASNWLGGTPDGNDSVFLAAGSGSYEITGIPSGYGGYRITSLSGAGSYTLTGGPITLFDFGGNVPLILNQSTNTLFLNTAVTYDYKTSNGQIQAQTGSIRFLNTVTLASDGSNATQLAIFNSSSSQTISFAGVLGQSGATGATVAINVPTNVVYEAANTYSGDTFVNAGTLHFAAGGSANSSTIRPGDTSGSTAAAINLTAAGASPASTLVVRPGSSGVKTLAASNGSGSVSWGGAIYLDADFATTTATAGTLNLTGSAGGTIDLKNQTLSVGGAGTTVISGNLQNSTGSGKLIKTGAGALYLSGNNSLTGGLTIQEAGAGSNSGVVRANSANALGTSNTVFLKNLTGTAGNAANNAEVQLNGVTIPVGVTLNVDSGSGDRRTNLRGVASTTSTWSGPITLSGTMGSVFQVHADGSLTIGNNVTAGSGFSTFNTYRGGGTGTVTGNISLGASGTLAKNDASTWEFQGTNTFGTLNISQGTARFTQPVGTGIPTAATILMNANTAGSPVLETNGTLPSRSLGNAAGSIQLSSALQAQNVGLSARGGDLSLTFAGSPAFGALVGGATGTANIGATSIAVSSSVGLAAGMTITGSGITNGAIITTVGTGTIGIGTATTGALSGAAITAAVTSSSTATTINTLALNLNATANSNANITFNNGFDVNIRGSAARTFNVGTQTVTIAGAVTNSVANNGTLTKSGAGTLAMTGGGSGLDMLRLNDGRVDLGGTWSLRRIATNSTNNLTLNITGATTTTMVDFAAQFVGDQTGAATTTVNIQPGGSWTQDRTGGNERDFAIGNGAGSQDAKAVVNVNGNFTITGNVNQIGIGGSTRASSRATTGSLNINSGGVADIQGLPTAANKVYLGASGNINVGTVIPSAGTVQAGTIVLNAGGTLRTSRTITEGAQLSNITSGRFFFNGGTLSATAGVSNVDWMSGLTGGFVQSGGAVINTNGAEMTIAQPLEPDTIFSTGPGSLSKWGNGVLTLSGSNTYTGATAINAGTLRLNGSHTGGGAYAVGDGTNPAVLEGTGSTASAVNVSNNATLSPGNSIGVLATGSVTFASGASFRVELDTTGGVVSAGDRLDVTGDVTLGAGGSSLVFAFAPVSSGPVSTSPSPIVILKNDGVEAVSGYFKDNNPSLVGSDLVANFDNGVLKYGLYYNYNAEASTFGGGNDVAVVFSEVPEPSTLGVVALAAGAMAWRRPRKRTNGMV